MRRTPNGKAILILLVSALSLGLAVHFVHGFQVKRNAAELLDIATQEEASGNGTSAVENLGYYLGLKPEDDEAQARYGLLLAKTLKKTKSKRLSLTAYMALEKALRGNPQREDVCRELAIVTIGMARFPDAKELLEPLHKAHPQDSEIDRLLGECAVGTGQWEEARAHFTKAIEHDKNDPKNFIALSMVLRQHLGDSRAADEQIVDMVKANAKSTIARMMAAEYYQRQNRWKEANTQIEEVLGYISPSPKQLATELPEEEIKPFAVKAFAWGAEIARRLRDPKKCRDRFEKGLKLYPKDVSLNLGLARLELSDSHPLRAKEILEGLRASVPSEPEDVAQLCDMLIDVDDLNLAEELLDRAPKGAPKPMAEYLRGRILIKKNDYGAAREVLLTSRGMARAAELAKRINLLLASCYEHLGDVDAQLTVYRQALQENPLDVEANIGAAEILSRRGNIKEAIEAYRKVFAKKPEVALNFARLLVLFNKDLPMEKRQWEEVNRVMAGMSKEQRDSPGAVVLRSEIAQGQGHEEEAARALDSAITKSPKEMGLWLARAALAEQQHHLDMGSRLLDEAERNIGKRPEVAEARMVFAVKKGGPEARKTLAGLEASLGSYTDGDQARLIQKLADGFHHLGDTREAVRLWKMTAALRPNDLNSRLLLFSAAFEAGDETEIRRILEEIKALEGQQGAFWAYGEGTRLARRVQKGEKELLPEAQKRAVEALARRPSWAPALLLCGEIRDLDGDPAAALVQFKKAVDLGSRQPVVIRRVVTGLFLERRYAEARNYLKFLDKSTVASLDMGRLAAELASMPDIANADNRRQAWILAREAIPVNSTNYQDYLWLGKMAAQADQTALAEKMFRQALSLNDKVANTWTALVLYLAQFDHGKAGAVLEEAQRKLGAEVAAPVLAAGYEAVGRFDDAAKQFDSLVSQKPGDPAILQAAANFYSRRRLPAKAGACWRALIKEGPLTSEAARSGARRQLALALGETKSYAKFKEAQALLADNAGKNSDAREDDRARARLLASQPAHRKEAIHLLESVTKAGTPPLDDQFILAQLYDADRDWPKARDLLMALVNSNQSNPTILAYLCQGLLRHKRVVAAAPWIDKLEALEPATQRTIFLKATLLKEQGKIPEGVALLKGFVGNQPDRLAVIAPLLEEWKQIAEAEKACRDYVDRSTKPQRVLFLARFLSRQKRVEDAMALCEKAWTTCPAEAVANTLVTVIRDAGAVTGAPCQAVQQRLDEEARKNPDSIWLLRLRGDLQDLEGNYSESIALYRQVLEKDPNDVLALNNLGWLLALKEGNGSEAIELLQRAIDLAGPLGDFLDTRAVAFLAANQFDNAIRDLEQVLGYSPAPSVYFHLAQAQTQAKNRTAARDAFQQAIDLRLEASSLHPLEREAFNRLNREFNSN